MRRALISVTDKSGIVEFAQGLQELGFEVVATGGTSARLQEAGVSVTDVSEVTGFPEILDGRVKTLHPHVHAGLLADRSNPEHVQELARKGIPPIDVLCVNLYDFESAAQTRAELGRLIESIDIGGPAMIRAAAKNYGSVYVVVEPKDYAAVLDSLRSGGDESLRLELAAKAFRHTAFYDSMVSRTLTGLTEEGPFPEKLTIGFRKAPEPMRYGENPHQAGAKYLDPLQVAASLVPLGQQAKEISYNNWLDADCAWNLVLDLQPRTCAILKHGNPCGVARSTSLAASYRLAKAADPVSSYGGIVAFRGAVDRACAEAMTEKGNFIEVVVSEGWESEDVLKRFREGAAWAQNTRVLVGDPAAARPPTQLRSIRGGVLVQESDFDPEDRDWVTVTARKPTDFELAAMKFLWKIVPHVKSNAIVVGTANELLGVGAGQMNRVQSVRLALEQAAERSVGAVLASDAFFPFKDGIETVAEAGITAVVQPGGSKRDEEVILAANEAGMAMVFTGVRHFQH
ncbi:MAG: bifunctional phosphoribosylaminoimidazolecarboxamide formyltransferase/IMP cyclohydrolase [Fimbriimonadaceae bacterium]|nr:MAG: bifunctional phosphoribosylaminoimidazolecarboxamide formyltransferase/IMP cyclohydrolase [Fimbriimonadaceae bacterium]